MQRYLLLITPVITTKPASSDLIIRAPAEKIRSSPCYTPNSHLQARPENPPSWILCWFILMVVMISHNPPIVLTCSASFLLLPRPFPQLPPSSSSCRMEHSEFLIFFHLHCIRFLDCLFPPCLANSSSCSWWWSRSPKPSAFVILESVSRCLLRVQLTYRAWFSTQVTVQ